MSGSLPTEVTVLTDVNVLAIALTDDHPAHDDVYPWIQNAIDGPNVLRRAEEKASRFSAGMNPTLPFALHQLIAQLDIPRYSNPSLQANLST